MKMHDGSAASSSRRADIEDEMLRKWAEEDNVMRGCSSDEDEEEDDDGDDFEDDIVPKNVEVPQNSEHVHEDRWKRSARNAFHIVIQRPLTRVENEEEWFVRSSAEFGAIVRSVPRTAKGKPIATKNPLQPKPSKSTTRFKAAADISRMKQRKKYKTIREKEVVDEQAAKERALDDQLAAAFAVMHHLATFGCVKFQTLPSIYITDRWKRSARNAFHIVIQRPLTRVENEEEWFVRSSAEFGAIVRSVPRTAKGKPIASKNPLQPKPSKSTTRFKATADISRMKQRKKYKTIREKEVVDEQAAKERALDDQLAAAFAGRQEK
ncbi:hypothetical protein LINPERPRIM_LOCUS41611 [Linum perenne]